MNLAIYLLTAMLAWSHVPADCADAAACRNWEHLYAETADESRARYETIARQVSAEASSRTGNRRAIARHALELLAVAFEESRFAVLVDDGSCNEPYVEEPARSRIRALGGCDSGRAFTLWQLHPESTHDVQVGVTGTDLLGDRTLAIRISWELLWTRPVAWSTWSRASRRAAVWMAGHPF